MRQNSKNVKSLERDVCAKSGERREKNGGNGPERKWGGGGGGVRGCQAERQAERGADRRRRRTCWTRHSFKFPSCVIGGLYPNV